MHKVLAFAAAAFVACSKWLNKKVFVPASSFFVELKAGYTSLLCLCSKHFFKAGGLCFFKNIFYP
jgi:hypothetical protein